jgi:GWxTD domain-containing protein
MDACQIGYFCKKPAMKILSGLILFLLSWIAIGQTSMQAYLSYNTFNSPSGGPYLETYLAVDASSLQWKQGKELKWEASAEVTIIVWKDSTIYTFKKYELNAPAQADTGKLSFNIIDQQRFLLPNGSYILDIKVQDMNSTSKPLQSKEPVYIEYLSGALAFSGIEFIDSYKASVSPNVLTKSGFDLVPYVFTYYPEGQTSLKCYTEIYNSHKFFGDGAGFLLKAYIQSFETGAEIPATVQNRRMTGKEVNVFLSEFDLKDLPSGNYLFVIELINRENKLQVSTSQFFQRSNPNLVFDVGKLSGINTLNTFVDRITPFDSLVYFIHSLAPISTEIEKIYTSTGLSTGDVEMMKKYFYAFWASRSPQNPEGSWEAYRQQVYKTNAMFGTSIKAGFETERGRVYLQYGAPNTVSKEINDPSAYPYEIWHYYSLNNQKNKKFVFYNPDLVTNDYELIHSDAMGEMYNASWQLMLYKRDTPSRNLDDTGERDQWGSRTRKYFSTPF